MKRNNSFSKFITNRIAWRFASTTCILFYLIFILIHLTIIIGAALFDSFPKNIVWGGMAKTQTQLIRFEFISISVMTLCLAFTLIRTNHLKIRRLHSFSRYTMWIFFVYFLFNTIGNIMAPTAFEKALAPAALILSITSLRLALAEHR